MADDNQDPRFADLPNYQGGVPDDSQSADLQGTIGQNLNPPGDVGQPTPNMDLGLPDTFKDRWKPVDQPHQQEPASSEGVALSDPYTAAGTQGTSLSDHFARKNAMAPDIWDSWKKKLDPQGNKPMGQVGLEIVAAQTPENQVPALQANFKMADLGIATAATAVRNGNLYQGTEFLNHAVPLIPALHDVSFSPTRDGMEIIQGDQKYVLNSSQAHTLLRDPGFHPDMLQRGGKDGLAALISKVSQDRSPIGAQGPGSEPRLPDNRSPIGPQGPGSENTMTAPSQYEGPTREQFLSDSRDPSTPLPQAAGDRSPQETSSNVGEDVSWRPGVNTWHPGEWKQAQPPTREQFAAGLKDPKQRANFKSVDEAEQDRIIDNWMGQHYTTMMSGPNAGYVEAQARPPSPRNRTARWDAATVGREGSVDTSTLPGLTPNDAREAIPSAQQGAQQFQSQLPQGQAANPRGRGTFIPDQKNPGHGAWTGGESVEPPSQSSGAQNTASQPRPGSVGPNDMVNYMGQDMTHAQAREQSEKFAAEHPQQPGWAASGTPVPAPQRNDRGKVVSTQGGRGGGGGRTPAGQRGLTTDEEGHTAGERSGEMTRETHHYKLLSDKLANGEQLSPEAVNWMKQYDAAIYGRGRPAQQQQDQPPPEALSKLQEGVETPFNNGQVWTKRGGQAIRVR